MNLRALADEYLAAKAAEPVIAGLVHRAIAAQLDAVGGYAQTTPNARGNGHTYERDPPPEAALWSPGVYDVNEPRRPETYAAGDECRRLERVWDEARQRLSRVQLAIEEALGRHNVTSPAQILVAVLAQKSPEPRVVLSWTCRDWKTTASVLVDNDTALSAAKALYATGGCAVITLGLADGNDVLMCPWVDDAALSLREPRP